MEAEQRLNYIRHFYLFLGNLQSVYFLTIINGGIDFSLLAAASFYLWVAARTHPAPKSRGHTHKKKKEEDVESSGHDLDGARCVELLSGRVVRANERAGRIKESKDEKSQPSLANQVIKNGGIFGYTRMPHHVDNRFDVYVRRNLNQSNCTLNKVKRTFKRRLSTSSSWRETI